MMRYSVEEQNQYFIDKSCVQPVVYRDCLITTADDGMPAAMGKSIVPSDAKGSFEFVDISFRDHTFIHHYFHFVELMLVAAGIMQGYFPRLKVRRVYFGRQTWQNIGQNSVQTFLLKAILAPEEIIDNGRDVFDRSPLLVEIDRYGGGVLLFNKFVEPFYELITGAMPQIKRGVLTSMACPIKRGGEKPKAVYVVRQPPRRLDQSLEQLLLVEIEAAGFDLEIVDFAQLSFAEQVCKANSAFLLVGVHGNGLTNCLWQEKGSLLIELFPQGCHQYDYQFLAELSELTYRGVEGLSTGNFIYAGGSRHGAPGGDTNKSVDQLPMRDLRFILVKAFRAWKDTKAE